MMPVPRIKIYMDGIIVEKGKYYHAVFRYNGKQIWRSTGVKVKGGRKKDAERIKNEIIQNYINGINPNGDMLLTQYLDNWIKKVGPTLKPSTYEDYEKRVYGKLIPYFESKKLKLNDLKPSIVTEYLCYLKENGRSDGTGGLSKKSVENTKIVLSAALDAAVKDKIIKENPVKNCTMPSFEDEIKEEIYVYNSSEINKLLSYTKEKGSHIYPFIVLALFTGLRRGEMMALQWSDVKFDEGLLVINKNRTGTKSAVTKKITTPKSESSNRRIPIHPALVEVLKAEKARQDDLRAYMGKSYPGENFVILSTDIMPYANLSAINRVLNRLIKGACLPHTTIHGLRHAVATVLDDQGTSIRDISVLLGHKSVQTTEKIYIDRIRKAKKENIDVLGSVINI